jgi:hypothetical protein
MTVTAALSSQPAAFEATHNAPAADAHLKALPASARDKLERLRRIETRSRALIDGMLDELQRVRERRDDAVRALGRFDRDYKPEASFTVQDDGKRVPTVFPERVALVERIENCKAELTRLAAEQEAANTGFSTANLLDWLASQSAKFITAPVSLLKLTRGESLSDALAHNRVAQVTVQADLAIAQNAPPTIGCRPECGWNSVWRDLR